MNDKNMPASLYAQSQTCLSLIAALSFATPTLSDTLPVALAEAYRSNPDLLAARAALRGVDEEVAIARSGYRPSLSIDATASQTDQDAGAIGQGRVGLQLDQSLFDGSVTRNTVRGALARVDSEHGALSATEQEVLLSVITAYLDVLRDTDVVGIREANLKFLTQQVRSAKTRFDVGDDTNTAIAEAQAREADAIAQLARAQAQRSISESTYREIIGKAPTDPQSVVLPEDLLPTTMAVAIEEAMQTHPSLASVLALGEAARFDVNRTRGALRPTVGVSARVERVGDDLPIGDARRQDGTSASVSLQLRVPLYQAGLASARVRQARQMVEQRDLQSEATRTRIRSTVESGWAQLVAARSAQTATEQQIQAAQLAREGKLNEQAVGLVTTLDVLNAQQDVLAAEWASIGAERDTILASYSLLAATGRLQTSLLTLPVEPYEPAVHFDATNRRWFGSHVPPMP